MTRKRSGLGTGLAGMSFVERLSSRYEISPRLVVFGGGCALVLLLALVCWLGFMQGGWLQREALEPQGSSALIQLSTEFDDAHAAPVDDTTAVPVISAPQMIVVYVTGAVASPGLYTLADTSRVGDAVEAAGGLIPEAAAAVVNLAQHITDGMQIHIPRTDEVAQDAPVAAVSSPAGIAAGVVAGGAETSPLVNINTADSATLQSLTGIGPATAQKIIDYRTVHGPFARKEDLRLVSGIGEKKYAAIEALITV